MINGPETEPLTQYERDYLMGIYTTRRNCLWQIFAGCFVFMMFFFFSSLYFVVLAFINDLFLGGHETWLVNGKYLEGAAVRVAISIVISVIAVCYTYYFEITPFGKDAESGIKQLIPFIITDKEYYPVTDQYFVRVKGVRNKMFRVSAEVYSTLQEGDSMRIGRSINARCLLAQEVEC